MNSDEHKQYDLMESAPPAVPETVRHAPDAPAAGPDGEHDSKTGLDLVNIKLIDPSPHQARIDIDDESVQELAESISEAGLGTPIVVRQVGRRYHVVSGHRRLLAMQSLGWRSVPVIIISVDDREAARSTMATNHNSRRVSPFEKMREIAILDAAHDGKIPGVQIAKILGRNEATVSEYRGYAAQITTEVLEAAGINIDDPKHAGRLRSLKRDQLREISKEEDPAERVRQLRDLIHAGPNEPAGPPLDLDTVISRTLDGDGTWNIAIKLSQVPPDKFQWVRRGLTQLLREAYRTATHQVKRSRLQKHLPTIQGG